MRRLLPFLSIIGLLAGGHPAWAQIDVKAMAMMDGTCGAEIEGRTVACTPFGTFVEFGNGRRMIAFSRDGVLYSFSGSRVQPQSGGFALAVDMIRIASEKAPDRDLGDSQGQCVVQTQGANGAFTAIACDARSPGQNARYKFRLDNISNFERKSSR